MNQSCASSVSDEARDAIEGKTRLVIYFTNYQNGQITLQSELLGLQDCYEPPAKLELKPGPGLTTARRSRGRGRRPAPGRGAPSAGRARAGRGACRTCRAETKSGACRPPPACEKPRGPCRPPPRACEKVRGPGPRAELGHLAHLPAAVVGLPVEDAAADQLLGAPELVSFSSITKTDFYLLFFNEY
eukprot:CAMPEP_0113683002 /NCGR_PEP_ID=MMETSP0038_2-20120614/13023_1 /TAXON_ID=2898 /ORGANISM="Cryptomonas paramecium" /LENGTH=186 /DNA_ID=CAMNT_0000602227 /DNA_START=41 /DNA_END=601 /DNA_ORIENTATION=+ /assembly_acc=CAM_ASM_000170